MLCGCLNTFGCVLVRIGQETDERVAFPSVDFRPLPTLSSITPSRIVQIKKMTSDSGSTLRELRNGHMERRIRTLDEEVMAKIKRDP